MKGMTKRMWPRAACSIGTLFFVLMIPGMAKAQEAQAPITGLSTNDILLFAFEKQRIAVIHRALRGVASIQAASDAHGNDIVSSGTAFFITSDGLLMTNSHVVSDTTLHYFIEMNNGRVLPADVVDRDNAADIALLQVDLRLSPSLQIAISDRLELGQTAMTIGNALGAFTNSVSVGVVSGLSRSIIADAEDGTGKTEHLSEVIQTDAAINAGNSGGPLLNAQGQVIGMNTAFAKDGQGIGFAIPAKALRKHLAAYRLAQKRQRQINRPQETSNTRQCAPAECSK